MGAYLNDVQDLDLKNHSFAADVYVWFKWRDPAIDPSKTVEFLNPYDRWGHTRTVEYEQGPRTLGSGELFQVVRVQGRFSRKLSLEDYPFDRQQIVLELEDSRLESHDVRFVPDKSPVARNPALRLPGYLLGDPKLTVDEFAYPTDFGLESEDAGTSYSRVRIELPIRRPMGTYAGKLLLPVFCVVFCTSLMFRCHPKYVDARVGIGVTALLTIVALQITLNEDLPQIEYLILLDKVYIASYLFIIASLAMVLRATRLVDSGRSERAERLDAWSLGLLGLAYVAAIGGLVADSVLR